MQISRILSFIEKWKLDDQVSTNDKLLLANLYQHFSQISPDHVLTAANASDHQHIQNLKQFFLAYKTNYTLSITAFDNDCVALAKELSLITKESYLKILIPNLVNQHDYNDFSQLNALSHPSQGFFNTDATVLYSKKGFIDHLTSKTIDYKLSLYRDQVLCPLTIPELANLYAYKEAEDLRSYGITDESFFNTWDFLKSKVFTKLQNKGRINNHLIIKLLKLTETYFQCKQKKLPFKDFSQAFDLFLTSFGKFKLDNVNWFYGIRIDDKLLLEIFVDIYLARDYQLDNQMLALARFLFKYNAALQINAPELSELYKPQASSSSLHNTESPKAQKTESSMASVHVIWNLLLSMFVFKFKDESLFQLGLFFKTPELTISSWDSSNTVSKEAEKVFKELSRVTVAPSVSTEVLDKAYDSIKKSLREPAGLESHFSGSPSSGSDHGTPNAFKKWSAMVLNDDYESHQITFIDPRLFMLAYYKYNATQEKLASEVRIILDELIRTYNQPEKVKATDAQKKLRLNILCYNFIKKLPSSEEMRDIRLLLRLYNSYDADRVFLPRCQSYLLNRMIEIAEVPKDKEQAFIQHMQMEIPLSTEPVTVTSIAKLGVSKLVGHYTNKISGLNTLLSNANSRLKLTSYLTGLGLPILSIEAKNNADRTVPSNSGSFGAFNY